jgi:peptidoglycan/xylan/chitin deacetylase (PgdA/CDA1 family)
MRSVLGLVALVLVVSAFVTGYAHQRESEEFGPQQDPPPVRLPAADLARFATAAGTPPGVATAPIVLAYHDISAHPRGRYQVSREDFARQMAMLHAAGYRTLTGEEFVDILHGAPAPPRSVLITFDDGPQGLWTYADPILARYDFHAVALVITARLDQRAGPYYLSWPEVQRMAASGRWTIGSHTRGSHRTIPVNASGTQKSALVNRRWTAKGRESLADFQRRADADLRGSITDLTSHGLPRPRLFAYPFSEASLPGQDPQALRYVIDRVGQLFDAAFSSSTSSPEPVDERVRSRRPLIIDRLEVVRSTSAAQLFAAMQRMRTLPVALASPAAPDAPWLAPDGRAAPVVTDGSTVRIRSTARYVVAHYAPQATADWNHYRFRATVRGLGVPHTVTASLHGRVGGDPVVVRLSARQLEVAVRGQKSVVTRLPPRDSHVVTIEIRGARTVVTVDGVTYHDRRSASVPAGGGAGVAVFRGDPATPFPRFDDISIDPLTSG